MQFGYDHLSNLDLGSIEDSLTFLGAGGKDKIYKYPVSDISLFYMLLSAHFISAIFLFGEKVVEKYHNFPVLHGFFTNMICTCFYTLVVIYCLYKERMLINNTGKQPFECDSLVTAWLKFEIRILLMWLISCSIFLLYGQCFRFKSKWKSVEE